MPTVIALDVSLSMIRLVNIQNRSEPASYHQIACKAINRFLDHLNTNSKLEFVSLIVYSTLYEVLVDFTRDYELIRQALLKVEHYDKTNLETVLQAIDNILISNWGSQNFCQVLVVTDCGVGLGSNSLKTTITNLQGNKKPTATTPQSERPWLPFAYPSKLNFICLGLLSDMYFKKATNLYQQLLDVSGQKGELFIPKSCSAISDDVEIIQEDSEKLDPLIPVYNRHALNEMVDQMCELNYKQFETMLKCGSYSKLECPILIWPPPLPYVSKDDTQTDRVKIISKRIEITGFINLPDIGSPNSVSRHLIFPKIMSSEQSISKLPDKMSKSSKNTDNSLTTGFDRLELEIKNLYAKNEANSDDEGPAPQNSNDPASKESVCVLLHGALKVENLAALVLLNDDWFGFIYSYADSKKKSNLMLTVLPPGHDIIPWLGDLRYLGTIDDALIGETPSFPVKPEKRSYSQNCVVWIRHTGLQSDIQKVLRHAKKLPEKTQHFYKELNRIRRAALSLGFVELLEGLSCIFEREVASLPATASPDCSIQLKHVAKELKKSTNRDLKSMITAVSTKYNQLT